MSAMLTLSGLERIFDFSNDELEGELRRLDFLLNSTQAQTATAKIDVALSATVTNSYFEHNFR